MAWVLRGLRNGIVTTRYPRRPDGYGTDFHGAVSVLPGDPGRAAARDEDPDSLAALCPTGAISPLAAASVHGAPVTVDRGRCILCGRCTAERPDRFRFEPTVETAALSREALTVPPVLEDDAALAAVRGDLYHRVRALRRSIHIRHVDAGSDGSEEWEVSALLNPVYDVQRLGIYFTATPRHADVLLVSGVGTAGMAEPLRRTFDAMPEPRVVLATGTEATSGGIVHPTYASGPGVGSILPVDVWIPGSPPSPFSILHGILLGIGLLPSSKATA